MPYGNRRYWSGSRYNGDISAGKRHGKGTKVWANGDVYEGEWQQDAREGHGQFRTHDGSVYEGEWHQNVRHGRGKLEFPNGDVYDGDWNNDIAEGQGKFVKANGNIYEGTYVNGKCHGFGVYRFPNGNTYKGEWVNNLKQGEGLVEWADGRRFKGTFKADCPLMGEYRERDGAVYAVEYDGHHSFSESLQPKKKALLRAAPPQPPPSAAASSGPAKPSRPPPPVGAAHPPPKPSKPAPAPPAPAPPLKDLPPARPPPFPTLPSKAPDLPPAAPPPPAPPLLPSFDLLDLSDPTPPPKAPPPLPSTVAPAVPAPSDPLGDLLGLSAPLPPTSSARSPDPDPFDLLLSAPPPAPAPAPPSHPHQAPTALSPPSSAPPHPAKPAPPPPPAAAPANRPPSTILAQGSGGGSASTWDSIFQKAQTRSQTQQGAPGGEAADAAARRQRRAARADLPWSRAAFECPLTDEVMSDPVVCADGHSYDRPAISRWLELRGTSPVTGLPLPSSALRDNPVLLARIRQWQRQRDLALDPALLSLQGEVCGTGAWGTVKKGLLRAPDGAFSTPVAVKMWPAAGSDLERTFFSREVEMYRRVGGCHRVCVLRGTCRKGPHLCLIMRLYAQTLTHVLSSFPQRRLPMALAVDLASQAFEGLAKLAECAVVYMDMKPQNLLLDDEGQLVICDLGVACPLPPGGGLHMPDQILGTVNYMAPEMFEPAKHGGVGCKSDVWGAACCLVEMLSGEMPWRGRQHGAIRDAVCSRQMKPQMPKDLPPHLSSLVLRCFQYQPSNRPEAAAAQAALVAIHYDLREPEASPTPQQPPPHPAANAPAPSSASAAHAAPPAAATALASLDDLFAPLNAPPPQTPTAPPPRAPPSHAPSTTQPAASGAVSVNLIDI